jgi:4-hydroxy-3-methylbut-2-enyl diphosphate reductase
MLKYLSLQSKRQEKVGMPIDIIRADHLGMCFGVRDAIALAHRESEQAPLTILGSLVHNASVLRTLEDKGIAFADEPGQVRTGTVMVTAHGASERRLAALRAHGLAVVEATCPLVHVAHRAVAALVADGYHPVIVGQRSHVEVRGLTEDLDTFDVVLDEADVEALPPYPRIGIAAQTTQPLERVRRIVAAIRDRFPGSDVRFVDTVCKPTKQRQAAAVEVARRADVVIVIGGANSNNTRELVATCREHCRRVHHVQLSDDIRPDWFTPSDVVGITAGTSTPDAVIEAVESRIQTIAAGYGAATVLAGESGR